MEIPPPKADAAALRSTVTKVQEEKDARQKNTKPNVDTEVAWHESTFGPLSAHFAEPLSRNSDRPLPRRALRFVA